MALGVVRFAIWARTALHAVRRTGHLRLRIRLDIDVDSIDGTATAATAAGRSTGWQKAMVRMADVAAADTNDAAMMVMMMAEHAGRMSVRAQRIHVAHFADARRNARLQSAQRTVERVRSVRSVRMRRSVRMGRSADVRTARRMAARAEWQAER